MNEKSVFVDTGAWYALTDISDRRHRKAIDIYPKLLKSYQQLVTTNLVIAETYILIRRSLGHKPAISFLDNIAASPRIIKIYSENLLEQKAEHILKKYQDQDFSYTDALSFAVMTHYDIVKAFSFDHHFKIAGFTLIS
jgi:predicted nucleic acid-binding protein